MARLGGRLLPAQRSGTTNYLYFQGWVDFEVSINGGPYYWKGMFYVGKFSKPDGNEKCVYKYFFSTETPSTSPALVWFEKEDPYHMVSIKYSTIFFTHVTKYFLYLQIILCMYSFYQLLLLLSTART